MHQQNRSGVDAGIREGPVQSEVRNGTVLLGGSDGLVQLSYELPPCFQSPGAAWHSTGREVAGFRVDPDSRTPQPVDLILSFKQIL